MGQVLCLRCGGLPIDQCECNKTTEELDNEKWELSFVIVARLPLMAISVTVVLLLRSGNECGTFQRIRLLSPL